AADRPRSILGRSRPAARSRLRRSYPVTSSPRSFSPAFSRLEKNFPRESGFQPSHSRETSISLAFLAFFCPRKISLPRGFETSTCARFIGIAQGCESRRAYSAEGVFLA